MPHDALKGLHRTRPKLADGTKRDYYYAWRGGPRITSEFGTPDFEAEFHLLHRQEANKTRATGAQNLARLFDGYRDSAKFEKLAPRTQADYRGILDTLGEEFGAVPIKDLYVKGTRATFLDWRDEFGESSARQADYHWTVLNVVMNWALGRELIDRNPFTKAEKLYGSTRVDKIWTKAHQDALLAVAPPHMRLAFLLALYTGQRQGDLLALKWANYDGVRLTLRQGKTGAQVSVKLVGIVKAELDATEREHENVLVTARGGEPWTEDGFRSSWRKLKTAAGIVGLTFHDLRGTAVTMLFLAGCSEAEIATITGHSLKDVRSILDAHYFHRDTRLGDAAIDKLEKALAAVSSPGNDNAEAAALPMGPKKQFNGYTGTKRLRMKAGPKPPAGAVKTS